MRIHIKLTRNVEIVPFNYQQNLVGCLHKWLGRNDLHDKQSMYSISWLSAGKRKGDGLNFENGASWFISSPDSGFLKRIIKGIQQDSNVAFGMKVVELTIQQTPKFSEEEKFYTPTAILIARTIGKNKKQYGFNDESVNEILTETFRSKLKKFGINDETASIAFDTNYYKAKRKVVIYRGIENKANICPVIVKGKPESIAFAWDTGIGNSTGIGFGALK